jgi:hypothetical protein
MAMESFGIWQAELDLVRMDLEAEAKDAFAADLAQTFLDEFDKTQSSEALVNFFACLCFAAGQLGDRDRLLRFSGLM